LAVATAVESVSFVFAAAGVERRHSAQMSEGGFVAEPTGVVARGDQERGQALSSLVGLGNSAMSASWPSSMC
jgi:hypothetical protein